MIEALPSYGRGRERSGGRHISLLHGYKVNDLVITGTCVVEILNINLDVTLRYVTLRYTLRCRKEWEH